MSKSAYLEKTPATSPLPTAKPQLTAWLKEASRTGAELASAAGKFPETDRLIAAHAAALTVTLSTLSHSSDKATRARVAANPNTASADYVRLGQQFPNEFLANPLLDLLLLENPGLLEEVPEALLVRVLKREACPADVLLWAAGLPAEKVQLAVAMNARAPAEALERLRQSAHAKVRESVPAAAQAAVVDPEAAFREAVRERLAALSPEDASEAWSKKDIGLAQFGVLSVEARGRILGESSFFRSLEQALRQTLKALASNLSLPVSMLEGLAKDQDHSVRGSVASNPHTPEYVLEALAKDEYWGVRRSVAKNPRTPEHLLEALAKDGNRDVRRSVAKNPRTPESLAVSVLEALAEDSYSWARRSVAENPRTPEPLLAELAKDKDEDVRRSVAENPRTPEHMLEAVAKDKDKWVRHSVASNSRTPEHVLEALAKDKEWYVRSSVAANPRTPEPLAVASLEALAKHKDPDVRSHAAKNPRTPQHVLEALAKDKDWRVRSSVAANPRTPEHVLEALAKDKEWYVRSSVAENPRTPEPLAVSLLEALAKDKDQSVRSSVVANPRTPERALVALAKDKYKYVRSSVAENPRTPEHALVTLATDKDSSVRSKIAENPRTPEPLAVSLLEALAKDKDSSVRSRVAANPRTPEHVLEFPLKQAEVLQAEKADALALKQGSAWLSKEFSKAPKEAKEAFTQGDFLFFHGNDPNKAVLSKREIGVVLALSAGPFVEPARMVRVVGSGSWLVRAALARNRGTPPNLRKKLAGDGHPLVRALALTAEAPPQPKPADAAQDPPRGYSADRVGKEIAALLKGAAGVSVREELAGDRNTPEHLLEALAKDDAWVRSAVAANPQAPAAVKQAHARFLEESAQLLSTDGAPALPEASVHAWLQMLTDFPAAPDNKALTKASRSKNWLVRLGVALHPSATRAMLELLSADADADVAGAACQRLAAMKPK